MQLLVSPTSVSEARECVKAGVDIIDCKNPREGSLGANFPWVIGEIRELLANSPGQFQFSATVGDVPNLPGTVSLAARGLATLGVDYVKIGLMGPETTEDAVTVLSSAVRAVREVDSRIQVVGAGYSDYKRLKGRSVPPLEIPAICKEAGADVAMLDTAIKDGASILQFLDPGDLKQFLHRARQFNLVTALAGSLGETDIPVMMDLAPDIIGVRSIVCDNFDRVHGSIRAPLISKLLSQIAAAPHPLP